MPLNMPMITRIRNLSTVARPLAVRCLALMLSLGGTWIPSALAGPGAIEIPSVKPSSGPMVTNSQSVISPSPTNQGYGRLGNIANKGLAFLEPPTAVKDTPKQPPGIETKANTPAAVVPFEMLASNHMLVKATINGKGPYFLIFDLGAPITLLSNKAAEASGVIDGKTPRGFLFAMRGEAQIDRMETGELKATKLPAMVFDHPALTVLSRALNRKIDGIIGFTLFARYTTTIDYQRRQMTFRPVDFAMRDLMKELPDRLMGPKTAKQRVLAPAGLWGLRLGSPSPGLGALGVSVAEVLAGSPAERAGLKSDDIITTIDGRWTASIADVYTAVSHVKPGTKTEVVILRGGKEQTLSLEPADGV